MEPFPSFTWYQNFIMVRSWLLVKSSPINSPQPVDQELGRDPSFTSSTPGLQPQPLPFDARAGGKAIGFIVNPFYCGLSCCELSSNSPSAVTWNWPCSLLNQTSNESWALLQPQICNSLIPLAALVTGCCAHQLLCATNPGFLSLPITNPPHLCIGMFFISVIHHFHQQPVPFLVSVPLTEKWAELVALPTMSLVSAHVCAHLLSTPCPSSIVINFGSFQPNRTKQLAWISGLEYNLCIPDCHGIGIESFPLAQMMKSINSAVGLIDLNFSTNHLSWDHLL